MAPFSKTHLFGRALLFNLTLFGGVLPGNMALSHSGAFSKDIQNRQQHQKDPGMVGREDRGTVTMLAPHTTTEDPWGSVLGLDVVMALILALLGIGISIAVGVLACRYWCQKQKKAKEEKTQRKSSIYKPSRDRNQERHLDRYNKVSVTSSSGLLPVQEEDEDDPFDPPADHYFTDVMQSKDACMVRDCSGRSRDRNNNDRSFISMVHVTPIPCDKPNTELIATDNSRVE